MSPRGPSSSSSPTATSAHRSVSAPYTRRPSGQPKSNRQQFSACGACRMRRVRCDLKELPIASAGPNPSCSNCKERGLKCVDEFADVKAVKLLRRGRRLQQVEAIYGKVTDPDAPSSSSSLIPNTRLPSLIPRLQPEFFTSPFWSWFSLQRPILDPSEFPARFYAHAKGTQSLGHEGGLLAMLLVVWASSFGVDERGVPLDDGDFTFASEPSPSDRSSRRSKSILNDRTRAARKEKTEAMLREVLELVDFHGVMRHPTWDGVRVLLLILPLLEDTHPLDRLMIHEATIFQANALCTLALPSPAGSLSTPSDDATVRARIYWYVHMQEGITTGIRGGRLVLTEEDLDAFQSTVSSFNSSGFSSPTSTTFSSAGAGQYAGASGSSPSMTMSSPNPGFNNNVQASHPYLHMSHLFSIPLHLGAVCRKVHSVLTGAKAARGIEDSSGMNVDADGMRDVWDGLERCWDEFEGVRRGGLATGDVDPMVERFVSGWQIFIFECHNHIREALKQYASNSSPPSPQGFASTTSSPHLSSAGCLAAHQLLDVSNRHCLRLLVPVLNIIKRHLGLSVSDADDAAGLFKWDTGLIRDGVFFAGFLTASVGTEAFARVARSPSVMGMGGHYGMKQESSEGGMDGGHIHDPHLHAQAQVLQSSSGHVGDVEEGVHVCLAAIREMRWAFSKSDEREENIQRIWQETQLRRHASIPPPQQQQPTYAAPPPSPIEYSSQQQHLHYQGAYENGLPPIVVVPSGARIDSAPTTACSSASSNGSGSGWPSYTPPGTAASGTSLSSHASGGSPIFSSHPPSGFKPSDMEAVPNEAFYHVAVNDLDQFSFSATSNGGGAMITGYHQQRSPITAPHGPSSGYLDFATGGGPNLLTEDVGMVSQFTDDANTFYR